MSTIDSNIVHNSPVGSGTPAPNNNDGVNNSGNVPNASSIGSPSCVPNTNTAAEGANAAISSVGSTSTAITTTTTIGEPLKIIKTQLIPFHALQSHSKLIATAPNTSIVPTITNISTSTTITTTIKPFTSTQTNNTHIINLSTTSHLPTMQLKNLSHPFAINSTVAAKITQVKNTETTGNATNASNSSPESHTINVPSPQLCSPSSSISSSNTSSDNAPTSAPTSCSEQTSFVSSANTSSSDTISTSGISCSSVSSATSESLSPTSTSLTATSGAATVTAVTISATPIALTIPPTTVNATSVPTSISVTTPVTLVNTTSSATTPIVSSSATIVTSSSISHIKTANSALGNTPNFINAAVSSTGVTGSTNIPSLTATVGAIKVSTGGNGPIALGSPVALNSSASPITTSASIRPITTGGQSAQVRVVMPSMIKQLDQTNPGRTQITALPASPVPRTMTNASITVTRPVTQGTYLPRATVTGVANGPRIVTPVRATPASIGGTGTTVTGITASGNFVKGTAVSRNTASPGTTIISPATNATWMTANSTTGQVQLIRNIPQQSRQRILTTQVVGTALGTAVTPTGNGISTAVVTGTPTATQVGIAVSTSNQNGQNQSANQQATIQSVSSPTTVSIHSTQQQPTYVATLSTVLPPRQHQALVYPTNVAATSQAISQAQSFNPTVATPQRFAVAAQLTAATGTTGTTRQIRPIQFSKSFSTAKLNTTSISIRAPNLPQLTPTITANVSGANVAAGSSSPRSTTVTCTSANVLPNANLSGTRIFQLQQPPNGATQQIIGPTGRLAGNVMLQPIILNTSSGGKIGIRTPNTMTAKVQPSLTITQLGISKLTPTGTATVTANALTPQTISTNIQTIGSTGGVVPSLSTPGTITGATNLSTSTAATQLLTAQNIITSSSSSNTATVVPVAISTRATPTGNILTGTITPIKNANGITLGKVMTSVAAPLTVSTNNIIETSATITPATISNINPVSSANANVFIQQRPNSTGGANVAISVPSSNSVSPPSPCTSSTTSHSTTTLPTTSSTAFLPAGSTIYYESIPASPVQVSSTGVLSLTTTTVTTSANIQNQNTSTSTITSMPYSTQISTSSTPTTFTVVPSSSCRTIGQLQLPVSSAGSQITAVPFRAFNQLSGGNVSSNSITAIDSIAVSQSKTHIIPPQQQIIIPAAHTNSNPPTSLHPGTQMVIPLQTSIKVATGPLSGSSTNAVMSNYIRKRDTEGSLRAAKNLGPTLLSMSSNSQSSCESPVPSSCGYRISPISMPLTIETLAKNERASALAAGILMPASDCSPKPISPTSTDGSTTLSVASSPGLDHHMQEGGLLQVATDSMHFSPIKELYANHPSTMHHSLPSTSGSSRNSSLDHRHELQMSPTSQRYNGGSIITYDCPPRKKSRRSTIDSQTSTQSHSSMILGPPDALTPLGVQLDSGGLLGGGSGDLLITTTSLQEDMHNPCLLSTSSSSTTITPTNGNKENAQPTEFILRKPRNCTLLNGYKLTWKATNNHFQRYSDVKPRKPNPSVIDLANQPNILSKINGWKIYHLQAQMINLCNDENSAYDRLAEMLKHLETHEPCSDTERVSDLIKGNMQRSKIIVDGVNEAQNQIMKIFDHKTHVSDIINRCASKRNFKKREKV